MQTRTWLSGALVALVGGGVLASSPLLHGQASAPSAGTKGRAGTAGPTSSAAGTTAGTAGTTSGAADGTAGAVGTTSGAAGQVDGARTPSADITRDVHEAVEQALEQAGLRDGRLAIDIERTVAEATEAAQEAMKNLDVKVVVDDAMQGLGALAGEARPRIGVQTRDVTAEEARAAGLNGITGAFAMDVPADSAAAKGGLKASDIITTVDGERVRSARQLSRLIAESPDGKALQVEYVRGTTRGSATITPERPAPRRMTMRDGQEGPTVRQFERRRVPGPDAMPREGGPDVQVFERRVLPPGGPGQEDREMFFRKMPGGSMRVWTSRGRLGVMAQPLSDQLAAYFGTKAGALVTQVNENTPAAKAGLKAGDVITAVNGKPVTDAGDIVDGLEGVADGKTVPVEIVRDKKPQTVSVTLQAPAATDQQRSVTRTRRFTA